MKSLNGQPDIENSFDLIKLSHHGSRKSLSNDLAKFIRCSKFIISTNHTSKKHPDKECLSRIIYVNKTNLMDTSFYYNYDIPKMIFKDDEKFKWNIHEYKPNFDNGITVSL